MVEAGEAPLGEIIQNGDDDMQEDLAFEKARFYETTLKIKTLYQRQKQLLHRLAEAGKKPDLSS